MNNILAGKKVLITGATGLIGKRLVSVLLDYGCQIVVLTRSKEKAEEVFDNRVEVLETDLKKLEPQNLGVDYVIHAAANTSSLAFVEEPVNIIIDNTIGTIKLFEFARVNPVKGFIYLSTMEVYGHPDKEDVIEENHESNLDSLSVRSSYPESKRLCECLCASYADQFGVPAKVIRLTQTFGIGVKYDDKRVFAEFARCVIEKRDIVLHTDGSTKRSYLYTDDAVNAILTVLVNGEVGEAYNAANEETFCSILEMAELVVEQCADGCISIVIEKDNAEEHLGYAPKLLMNLSTRKLRKLGWRPTVGLKEMFDLLIADMEQQSTAK